MALWGLTYNFILCPRDGFCLLKGFVAFHHVICDNVMVMILKRTFKIWLRILSVDIRDRNLASNSVILCQRSLFLS